MLFSVATPSLNQIAWLRCCAASVADQVRRKEIRVEHLIQDAGSEGIEGFAREIGAGFFRDGQQVFASHNPQSPTHVVSIHCEKDAGMYDAINRAWKRSGGDICSYLNADEQYLPGALAKVATAFEADPRTEMVLGDALLIDPEANLLSYRRVVSPSRAHTRVVHLGVMSCALFFRCSLLNEGFYFDPSWRAIGDAEWVYRLLSRGIRIRILPEPLAAFAITGDNMGANPAALEEARRWRASAPWVERCAAPALRVSHWLKKLRAGAYRKRAVTTSLYAPSNPTARQSKNRKSTPHAWPGSTI